MKTHIGPSVSLSAVIIRGCSGCGAKRELGKPCENCGNIEPGKVTDLGVIADHQKSWWKRFKWNLYGYRMAQVRIKKTNKEMLRSRSVAG